MKRRRRPESPDPLLLLRDEFLAPLSLDILRVFCRSSPPGMGDKTGPLSELTFCSRRIKPLVGDDLCWCLSGSLEGGGTCGEVKNCSLVGPSGASPKRAGNGNGWNLS